MEFITENLSVMGVIRGESGPVVILARLRFVLGCRVENERNQSSEHINVIHSHARRVQCKSRPE